jgi:hypothetical protein
MPLFGCFKTTITFAVANQKQIGYGNSKTGNN